jgi:hypothetical protein
MKSGEFREKPNGCKLLKKDTDLQLLFHTAQVLLLGGGRLRRNRLNVEFLYINLLESRNLEDWEGDWRMIMGCILRDLVLR